MANEIRSPSRLLATPRANAVSGTLVTSAAYSVPLVSQMITGDFNGDGLADVVTCGFINNGPPILTLLLSVRGGTPQTSSQSLPTESCTGLIAADLNRDGKLDLVVLDWTAPSYVVLLGGVSAPVLFAGSQPGSPGLDQVNVGIPAGLVGRGEIAVEFFVGGIAGNPLTVSIQ